MKKLSISIWPVACFLFFLFCQPVFGASAGEFTSVRGRVDITSPGESARPANQGDKIDASDIVRTKSDGRAEIRFVDGGIIQVAPGTRFKVSSYKIEEKETDGMLSLFRGKIRSIVPKIMGRKKKLEVRTKTAVAGVRGTDFFVYYQRGSSGAIFKEGEGYVYNINRPDEVMEIKAGQAMLVRTFDAAPIIRPVTAIEMNRHSKDTSPSGPLKKGQKEGVPESGDAAENPDAEKNLTTETKQDRSSQRSGTSRFAYFGDTAYVDEREIFTEFAYTIDIESFDGENFFYGLDVDEEGAGIRIPDTDQFVSMPFELDITDMEPSDYIETVWDLYVGNTSGYFTDGASSGGNIFASPVVREDVGIMDQGWGVSNLYCAGTYAEFNDLTYDSWFLNLNYRETAARRYYHFEGSAWSEGRVEAKAASAWVSWQECLTGIAGGKISGSYSSDGTWQATGRFVAMETEQFLEMVANRKSDLELLDIPCIEIGRADLTGGANGMTVNMNDVVFFSYTTGGDPAVWATNGVDGTFADIPQAGNSVQLSGSGLNADFTVRAWENDQWAATIENGSGTLNRTDGGSGNIGFQGGAAGTYSDGSFSGSGAGTANKQ